FARTRFLSDAQRNGTLGTRGKLEGKICVTRFLPNPIRAKIFCPLHPASRAPANRDGVQKYDVTIHCAASVQFARDVPKAKRRARASREILPDACNADVPTSRSRTNLDAARSGRRRRRE